ncbi:MAG: hypothetical protein A2Z17_04425 [Gammaproteobacteria bacterium RBG_16_66_13]|nr:MAG: hypothetical protein A2Z17_04425 [Gammaproteobacteria bacterium RBG_16_66_13]
MAEVRLLHDEALPVPIEAPDDEALRLGRLQENPYLPDEPKRRVAKMTPALKKKFCEAIATGATPTAAATALGLARSTVYYQLRIDADFAEAWREAQEQAADRYEEALDHLATKTRNVGAVIFGLKNLRPAKWRDRHEVEVERKSEHLHFIVQAPLAEIQRRFLERRQQVEQPRPKP